ncbi:site-2 protease family protein [uncultured Clostridium sp.]|uniref:site-2 protease family protein n=1 Tax=uncultured Clostridium sp. TaxID=59620 RepID=UPI0025D9B58C|nr:site-2 protease family protein [uncultured Clostridium sp.]
MKKNKKIFLLEFVILIVIGCIYKKILLGFTWAILHELVHIIVAKKYNVDLYNMSINVTGVKAELKDLDDINDRETLMIFSSGPLFNLVAFIILWLIREKFNVSYLDSSISINIGLVFFNMLPAYPLDGIRLYEVILGKRLLYKKAKNILISISFGVSITMLILFYLTIYIHRVNFSLLLAALLLTYTTFLERDRTVYLLMGNIFRKRRKLVKYSYLENKTVSVYYKLNLVRVLNLIDKNKFNSFYILDDELKVLKILNEDELLEALGEYGNITLEEVVKISANKDMR